jgi:phosphatidate cytidylyltransferase
LRLRIVTGLAMASVALGALWLGGLAFLGLVALATLLMWAEWAAMMRLGPGLRRAGLGLLAGVMALLAVISLGEVLLALAGGAALLGLFARGVQPGKGTLTAAGLLYCGLPALALLWTRGLSMGLAATLLLLVVVWTTDIAAFFAGRAIGGRKLAPRISPNKTWAGAVGGVVAAMFMAGLMASLYLPSGLGRWTLTMASFGGALAVLSVLGDLLESGLKRRAGVKDSGNILPGHGGVMDRLDGLVPVAVAGALVFWMTGWAG